MFCISSGSIGLNDTQITAISVLNGVLHEDGAVGFPTIQTSGLKSYHAWWLACRVLLSSAWVYGLITPLLTVGRAGQLFSSTT